VEASELREGNYYVQLESQGGPGTPAKRVYACAPAGKLATSTNSSDRKQQRPVKGQGKIQIKLGKVGETLEEVLLEGHATVARPMWLSSQHLLYIKSFHRISPEVMVKKILSLLQLRKGVSVETANTYAKSGCSRPR